MQQILAEGNNIGDWTTKKIINIEYLYLEAERCLINGNKMYDKNQLVEAFVYFMRLTKFYDLINENNHLVINDRRVLNIKRNVFRVISIMEQIKPKLSKKYDNIIEQIPLTALPSVPQTKNIAKELSEFSKNDNSIINIKIQPKYTEVDRINMLNNLDERWNNITSEYKVRTNETFLVPNTVRPIIPRQINTINTNNTSKISKTTDDINKHKTKLKYVDNNGKSLDALAILRMHLKVHNREVIDVPGDNNCQFHAIVDQLNQIKLSGWTDNILRKKAVQWLQDNEHRPMDDGKLGEQTGLKDAIGVTNWNVYIKEMLEHNITWGDEATLLALSVLFKMEIVIISSLPGNYVHSVKPPDFWNIDLKHKIYLGHYHEFHYTSSKSMNN